MMTTRQRVLALLATAAAAGVLAGCSGSTGGPVPTHTRSTRPSSTSSASPQVPQPGAYPSPTGNVSPARLAPGPASVNGADASAVALGAVRAIESSDTAVDADPNATVQRASAWLTAPFAAQVRRYRPVAAPGALWNEWSAHKAYVQVSTSLSGDDQPPATATRAYRQVVAELRPTGRDGWHGPAQRVVVFVTLTRSPGTPWRVSAEQQN